MLALIATTCLLVALLAFGLDMTCNLVQACRLERAEVRERPRRSR